MVLPEEQRRDGFQRKREGVGRHLLVHERVGTHDKQAGIDIIMRTARSLLGVPYVWLGVYPQDGGMDCASFTWYLYKQLGIDIGFETYDQMYSGVRVFGDPQPGDIILMYYGAWPNYNPMLPEHVVLYAAAE